MRRQWFITIVCMIGLGLIIQTNSAHAKLEDILYEKGQITKEEWVMLRPTLKKKKPLFNNEPRPKNGSTNSASAAMRNSAITILTDDKNLRSEYDSSIGR